MSKNPNEHLCKLANFRKLARKGYGMALLMTFLTSSILIGTSTAILLAPSLSNAVGSLALDEATARQLAEEAIDAAKADILTQQQAGTTIDTSYRYPSVGTNTISVPTYPGSASSTAKGTYYVTATYARGFSFLLKATVTVGANTFSLSRLVQLYNPPSLIEDAYAIYALRKVNPDYTGSAVRVRCATNPSGATTQDIGFDGSGNFDIAGLRTCLGDSTLPLNVATATGAKLAFGLRKLSSSYNGYAIKVRRSSDNTTQDIGFDSNGNLDAASLMNFVSTGNGYIDTWYDQSGSGKNATQGTTSKQPRIVNSGVMDTINNGPTIQFDGIDDYLSNTGLAGTLITGSNLTAFTVAQQDRTATSGDFSSFVSLHKSNGSNQEDWAVSGGYQVLGIDDNSTTLSTQLALQAAGAVTGIITSELPFIGTSYLDNTGSGNLRIYMNGSIRGSADVTTTLSPDQLYIGAGGKGTGVAASTYLNGRISEAIIFNSAVNMTDRAYIQRNQGHYFNISTLADGFVTTWYDQSGNNRNLTQAITSSQPTISTTSSRPAVYFNGTSNYLENTAQSTTTDKITAFTIAQVSNTGFVPSNGRIMSLGKTGDSNDWGQTSSTGLLLKFNNQFGNARNNDFAISTATSYAKDFQGTVLFDGTSRTLRQKQGSNYTATTNTSGSGNLVINRMRAGWSFNSGGSHEYWKGKIYEVIIYSTNLSATDYQQVETDEQTYFGI